MTDQERGELDRQDPINAMESVVQFKARLEAARLKEQRTSGGLRIGAPEPAPAEPASDTMRKR